MHAHGSTIHAIDISTYFDIFITEEEMDVGTRLPHHVHAVSMIVILCMCDARISYCLTTIGK